MALLQELKPPELQGESLLFEKVYRDWGTGILTRNMPLKEKKVESADAFPGRVAAGEVKVSPGYDVSVVSVHAPTIEGRVFPYLTEIFDEIERTVGKQMFIVGGDLNSARLAGKV